MFNIKGVGAHNPKTLCLQFAIVAALLLLMYARCIPSLVPPALWIVSSHDAIKKLPLSYFHIDKYQLKTLSISYDIHMIEVPSGDAVLHVHAPATHTMRTSMYGYVSDAQRVLCFSREEFACRTRVKLFATDAAAEGQRCKRWPAVSGRPESGSG